MKMFLCSAIFVSVSLTSVPAFASQNADETLLQCWVQPDDCSKVVGLFIESSDLDGMELDTELAMLATRLVDEIPDVEFDGLEKRRRAGFLTALNRIALRFEDKGMHSQAVAILSLIERIQRRRGELPSPN